MKPERTYWRSRIPQLLDLKSKAEGRQITITELALYLDVSRQTVHRWISDGGVPTIAADQTAQLMAFFHVPEWRLWELAEDEDDARDDLHAGTA
jgi:hypothetical protein